MINDPPNYRGSCRRGPEIPADPRSIDCGGDCWGGVGDIGADIAQRPAVEGSVVECRVRGDYLAGR